MSKPWSNDNKRVRYLGWLLSAVASLALIYLFSMHFRLDDKGLSSAVGVRPEIDKKTVTAGAGAAPKSTGSRDQELAARSFSGTWPSKIDDPIPDGASARSARLAALQELWHTAADAGVPDEALRELHAATYDPDPEIANYAAEALEDLERFQERLTMEPVDEQPIEGSTMESDVHEDTAFVVEEEIAAEDNDLERQLATMEQAIAELYDPATEDRVASLHKYWRTAADAGVPDEALAELDAATYDLDPEFADYAVNALEDLERLRDRLMAELDTELLPQENTTALGSDEDGAVEEGTAGEESDLELRLAAMDEAIADLYDPAKEDRLTSLLELWRTAADAEVPEEALAELDAATYDLDPEFADYAARALEDLERLRDRLTPELDTELLPEKNTTSSGSDEDG
jgi:hypothetical protein